MSGGDDVPSSSLASAGLEIFDMGLKITQNQARFILEYHPQNLKLHFCKSTLFQSHLSSLFLLKRLENCYITA